MPLYQYKNESVERTLYFIHIPKTGGSAVNSYLKKVGMSAFFDHAHFKPVERYLSVIPSHYDYETVNKLFRLDRMYSFAIVRNPIDKLVSEYKFYVQRFKLPVELKQLGFKEFLKFAVSKLDENPDFWKGHFRPQHHFVGPKVKRIFKYEEGLDSIVRRVFIDVGLKLDGSVKVLVKNTTIDQEIIIDSETIEFIVSRFSEDFTQFGYPVE